MRVLLLAAFACLVDLSCAALFHVEANSTCDSAPLYIEGELIASLDCIGGVEHSASALLDKNQSTLWQSAMGVSNVALSFSSLTTPPPVRVLAITLYWFSEPPKVVTVEQWNGQSFEPALVCNVTAGCLEPHSRGGSSCIPCDLVGTEQTLNFTAPGIAVPWNIVFTDFEAASNFYAIEEVSLSVTCDEGAHLTEAGCVYNSSCNSCETRLQQAASAVNSGAANVTTAIELFGNLSSAADGFAALDAAAAEDAAILAAITNALDSLYLNVFLVAGGVEASSNILIRFNSNLNSLLSELESFCIPNSTAIVNLVVSLKGKVNPVFISVERMDNAITWQAGNASTWENATRATIDKINATALLLAGWNYGDAAAESANEANAKQMWHDANATLGVVADQRDKAIYLKTIVDETSYRLEQASKQVNQLTSIVSALDSDGADLSRWRNNVRGYVADLNDSIASLEVDLAAASGLIDRSAFILSSARELLNASELLVAESISQALDSLGATVSSAEAQSAQCSQLVEKAANYTRLLQLQGAQIRSLLSASIDASATSNETYQRYESANQTLWQAEGASLRASGLLSEVLAELQLPSLNRTLEKAKWATNAANYTIYGAASVSRSSQGLSANFSSFQALLNVSTEEVSVMENLLDSVSVHLQLLQGVAYTTDQHVASVMNVANKATAQITSINSTISRITGTLSSNVTDSLAFLDTAKKLNSDTRLLLDAAQDNLTETGNTLKHTQSALSNISLQAATNEQKLDVLSGSVGSLMLQLQEAIKAAATIDLALHMYGSSSLQYKLPVASTSKSLQLSLDLRPDNTTGSLLYLEDMGYDYVELRLDEGNVVFESNTFGLKAGNGLVQVGHWYQIYASEDGTGSWLSVAPLQGGQVYTDTDNTTLQPNPITYNASVLIGGGQDLRDAYSGCIDHVIVNSVRLPLLVPDPLPSEVSTCAPRPPEEKRTLDNSSWFQGAGSYARFLHPAPSVNNSLSVRLQFRYPFFCGLHGRLRLGYSGPYPIRDAAESNRVYALSCPSELGSGVRFTGSPGGALFNKSSAAIKSVEFYFRSTQIMASLLHISQLSISLYHGMLRLDCPTGAMVTGQWGLNDNQWHSVSLNLTNGHITTVIDAGYSGPAVNGFRGCIANLRINQGVVDFFSAVLDGVALYGLQWTLQSCCSTNLFLISCGTFTICGQFINTCVEFITHRNSSFTQHECGNPFPCSNDK
eukprot:Em0009g1115a